MSDATVRPFVVIPCLDEERAIGEVLAGVLAQCRDVIVIDDGSTDRTAEIVERLPVTLLRHPERRGKGEALRTGFREALRRGASGILTMDGDGQHDPGDIRRLLEAALAWPHAVVIGARMLGREQQPTARRRANNFASWGISWGCGKPVIDAQSGQRWYPRAAVELADTPTQDFVFETALLIAAARDLDMQIVSVPIATRYHAGARTSHFRPVRDVTWITLYTIGRVAHYGRMVQSYRASHATPPIVHDPDNRLGARVPLPPRHAASAPRAEG
ncbi:MAG: glycosyltransferase family 2 protein [Rhodanobacteraceae bacterium]